LRIIIDTNVLISGIFFSGPPYQILQGWREGKYKLILSKVSLIPGIPTREYKSRGYFVGHSKIGSALAGCRRPREFDKCGRIWGSTIIKFFVADSYRLAARMTRMTFGG